MSASTSCRGREGVTHDLDRQRGSCGDSLPGGRGGVTGTYAPRMIQQAGLQASDNALDAAEAASPVEAVETVTRELGVALGATKVSYLIAHLFEHFIAGSFRTHLGPNAFAVFGTGLQPLMEGSAILAVYWLLLYWMYQRKLFLRI